VLELESWSLRKSCWPLANRAQEEIRERKSGVGI
jgi:hypothetical protein